MLASDRVAAGTELLAPLPIIRGPSLEVDEAYLSIMTYLPNYPEASVHGSPNSSFDLARHTVMMACSQQVSDYLALVTGSKIQNKQNVDDRIDLHAKLVALADSTKSAILSVESGVLEKLLPIDIPPAADAMGLLQRGDDQAVASLASRMMRPRHVAGLTS